MSEVKVNKISPRSGTDVTLGDSGDTIIVPAGVTLDASAATTTLPATVVTTTGTQTLTNKSIATTQLTGTVATSNLGTGTASSSTFLRGDQTYAAAGSPSITDNGNATAMTINSSEQVEFTAGTVSLPAITTTGDVNTGIFFPAPDTISFTTNGTRAMRINASGNISIGSTDDYHNLHVAADGTTTDGWFSSGLTASCSGAWNGSKSLNVTWDFTSSVSYVLEFLVASYGQRQFFAVGSYTAGTSHQTTLLSGGSSDMTQSYADSRETWTAGGGTHGVYSIRLHSAQGTNGALVTLV